jgi:hypothetical protein
VCSSNMSSEGGAWQVHGTKKGALPIAVEKRPCGKKVNTQAHTRARAHTQTQTPESVSGRKVYTPKP